MGFILTKREVLTPQKNSGIPPAPTHFATGGCFLDFSKIALGFRNLPQEMQEGSKQKKYRLVIGLARVKDGLISRAVYAKLEVDARWKGQMVQCLADRTMFQITMQMSLLEIQICGWPRNILALHQKLIVKSENKAKLGKFTMVSQPIGIG